MAARPLHLHPSPRFPQQHGKSTVARHATANIAKELSASQAKADIIKVTGAADVVGWQEIEDHGHVNALQALRPTWTTFWPGGSPSPTNAVAASNYVPISWRSDRFALVTSGHQQCIPGQPHVSPARYVVWVVLRDLRAPVTAPPHIRFRAHLNGHNIQKAWTTHPERRDEWRTWAAAATKKTQELATRYPTVGSADLNRNHWMMPLARMVYADHGTYGGSYYDALWVDSPPAHPATQTPAHATRIPLASDHDALVAAVRVSP